MLSANPLTVGVVIGSGELLDQTISRLTQLPVRMALDERQVGDWSAFIEKLNRTLVDVIIIELQQLSDPLEDVVRQIKSTTASPEVIVVHDTADPATILRVVRADADEYLYPPLGDDLEKALNRMASERAGRRVGTHPRGKIIGFLASKGGCGTTTIACHVAVELRRQTQLGVLLADFDLESGIVGFLMKAESRYSLEDALSNVHRMDLSFWKALVSNGRLGIEVVVAPPHPVSPAEHHPFELRDVLRFVRSNYDWVTVDLGRVPSPGFMTVLEEVDKLYVVTTPDVPALHRAKVVYRQLAEALQRSEAEEPAQLILNRVPRRMELTIDDIEAMLGTRIYATIRSDETALYEAYAAGKLVPAGSRLGRQFARLAGKIAGTEQQRKGRFSFLSI